MMGTVPRSLGAAFQFLTVVPVSVAYDAAEIGRSTPWFPVVGLAIGLAVSLLDWLVLDALFPPAVAAALGVLLLAAVSGGFHIDGLADTADGFLSSRPRDRVLEIMRDSRVGTMGVLAIVLVLALKLAALASMASQGRALGLLLAPLAGRCMLVVSMGSQPYARPEGGLATLFLEQRRAWHAGWALAFLAFVSIVAFGCSGLFLVLVPWGLVVLFNLHCRRRIGGITGDTVGAACELAEAAVLVTASALL